MPKKDVSGSVSRPLKANQVEIILYEIDMLQYCFQRLREPWESKGNDYYLCVEGFLLHYRNLSEFFGNHGRGLKARAPEHWSARSLSREELSSIQNIGPFRDHHQAISRLLTHCDKIRAEEGIGWRHIEMYGKIEPLFENFRKLFPSSPRPALRVEAISVQSASTATTSSYSPSLLDPDLIAAPPRKPAR
jgi:hypothetical protein